MQESVDISLQNTACRILVISHTTTLAQSCVHRIQNLGNTPHQSTIELDKAAAASDTSGSLSDLVKIPWTISNKYYSAPVHFAIHTVHGLSPHQCRNVPAVIFVWSNGEAIQSYKREIERIAQDLSGSEPEVCLAIRMTSRTPPNSTHAADEDEENEDDGEMDVFLTSLGFEYIDATEEETLDTGRDLEDGSRDDGIPRLPRVLDALSTIMWSSMQPITSVPSSLGGTRDRRQILLDWAHTTQDSGSPTIGEAGDISNTQPPTRTRSMKREMEELARWLEEDMQYRDDPWKSAATSSGGMVSSPTAMEPSDDELGAKGAIMGFDDDFTVFVSAPAVGDDDAEDIARSSPELSTAKLSPFSGIPHAGPLYKSLGSVSDFGDSEDWKHGEEDDDDESADDDLPTKNEILAASSRIFGPARSNTSAEEQTADIEPKDTKSSSRVVSDVESAASGGDGGSYDMEPFDLSKVVNALQEMKAEIATMEDEGERRKAAAKVALGLVYGLEADAHNTL